MKLREHVAFMLQTAEYNRLVDTYIGDDESDCGGWTWDPPCGGCGGCLRAQAAHCVRDLDHFRARARFRRHPVLFVKAARLRRRYR